MTIRRYNRQTRGQARDRGRKLRIQGLDRPWRLLLGASLVVAAGATTVAATAPPAAASPGQTLVVSTTGADSGNCVSSPCLTLGYAMSQAAAHDIISLEPGHYAESQNPSGTRNVVGPALSSLKIESQSGLASNTVIEAVGQLNGLVVNADDVTIQDLTIHGAGAEGILVTPPAPAIAPSTVTGETIKDDVVDNNDQCLSTPHASYCPAPSPDDDYGEAVHLESVTDSTLSGNTVDHNVGGILLTDEVGPTDANLISDNNVSYNAVDCGITLAGHSSKAVALSGPDTGKPQPSQAGVFDNKVIDNVASHNGGAGVLAAAAVPGAGAYDNSFKGNTASGDGLAGITIHSHTALQDVNGNLVEDNILSNDALHGGPGGTAGDAEGPPESANLNETTGVQVLAALAPVTGTVVEGNEISRVYYGVWISALASSTVISNNKTTPVTGGISVFKEPGPYSGYWMAASDGGAFAFGSAGFQGSAPGSVLGAPVVGIASTPDGGGYWLTAANGEVVGLGDATVYGTLKGKKLSSPIVGIAATQDGAGYWLVGSDGGVFAFGDAAFLGSVPGVLKPGQHLGAPIIGIASTPEGGGYWLVGSDGGVFSFGSAKFFGSVPGALKPGAHLSAPIVGVAASPGVLDTSTLGFDSNGYWLVAADGGVFAFGLARYVGSVPGALKPGQHLAAPVVSVAGA